MNCPKCGAKMNRHVAGKSINYFCPKCGEIVDKPRSSEGTSSVSDVIRMLSNKKKEMTNE